MQTRHHELRLTAKRGSLWILKQSLRFASKSRGWRPHPNGIVPGSMGVGPHCVVVYTERNPGACVALVTNRHSPKTSVRLTNVFPTESGYIPPDEYNRIVEHFVTDFRDYVTRTRSRITVKLSVFRLSLESVIPSVKCRTLFKSYLQQHPLTFHPCDIENLDQFICAVHRYNAKIDTDGIFAYLVEQRHWPNDAAQIVVQRILIGTQILRVNGRPRL